MGVTSCDYRKKLNPTGCWNDRIYGIYGNGPDKKNQPQQGRKEVFSICLLNIWNIFAFPGDPLMAAICIIRRADLFAISFTYMYELRLNVGFGVRAMYWSINIVGLVRDSSYWPVVSATLY